MDGTVRVGLANLNDIPHCESVRENRIFFLFQWVRIPVNVGRTQNYILEGLIAEHSPWSPHLTLEATP